ncbi:MAG: kynureninase, partial [Candidatus Eisenbacteria bacterium]
MIPATTTQDPLLGFRGEFPSLANTLHFASHTLGAMPRGVEDALRRYTDAWRTRGIRAWEDGWFASPTVIGDLLGGIINAEPGSISMHENVTSAEAIALSAMDFAPPRNRLVCTAEDFPSVLYLYEGLSRRGAEIVRVPAREGRRIAEENVIATID